MRNLHPGYFVALLLAGACAGPTDADPPDIRTQPLATELTGTPAGAVAPFTIFNETSQTVYLTACGSNPSVTVETLEGDRWHQLSGGICPTVLSMAPIRLAAGTSASGVVGIGSPGRYRLRAIFNSGPGEAIRVGPPSPTIKVVAIRMRPEGGTVPVSSLPIQFHAEGLGFTPAGWTWSVSDTTLASISGAGSFQVKRAGVVKVQVCAVGTVICSSVELTIATLPPRKGVMQVLVFPAQATLEVGARLQFSATGMGGAEPPWTWSVAAPDVALVSQTGEVIGIRAGTTEVRVCSSPIPVVCGTAQLTVR